MLKALLVSTIILNVQKMRKVNKFSLFELERSEFTLTAAKKSLSKSYFQKCLFSIHQAIFHTKTFKPNSEKGNTINKSRTCNKNLYPPNKL